jgi:hypothetical protein
MATVESDHLVKLRIGAALSERATRVAVLIVESVHLGVNLIDEQPTAVVEAVRDHLEQVIRDDPKSPRRELRDAMLGYCRYALEEARKRERRLYHGITGVPEEEP